MLDLESRRRTVSLTARLRHLATQTSSDYLFFSAALTIFLASRLIGIERFPIYFFTDEAVQTVRAAGFLHDGFRDAQGRLIPTYFQNGPYFNLSVSVYAQVIPYKIFGYSIFVTRATSALFGLTAAVAVGLTMRDIFRVRSWWLACLFLSITPAWFLHSRTAFETVIATSLYAWFLYFYLRYRYANVRNLYPALFFGAATFYAYSSTQLVVVLTGTALFFSDLPYHVRNWRAGLLGVAVLAVLILPYLRFQLTQGHEVYLHLRTLDSYWVKPGLSTSEKLSEFWSEYKFGLSPSYWFSPHNSRDLIRHLMKGYGNILIYTAPFFAVGLLTCLARIRESRCRAILIALLLSPIGGAIVAIAITRVLILVVPAAIVTGLGASLCVDYVSRFGFYRQVSLLAFTALAAVNLYMLNDALTNGPTWYDDYDIGGLQFGARQVTSAIEDELKQDPNLQILLSPTWTNGTNEVVQFLLHDGQQVRLGNIDAYLLDKLPMSRNQMFVMTPREYQKAITDAKLSNVVTERTVKYPNGRDGFYFVRLQYSDQADAFFASERLERSRPVTETVKTASGTSVVTHSRFDIGQASDLLDNDSFTLARTLEANPAVVDIAFDAPRTLSGVRLRLGTMKPSIVVSVSPADGSQVTRFESHSADRLTDPTIDIDFGSAINAASVRVEVEDLAVSGPAHVHVRDLILK